MVGHKVGFQCIWKIYCNQRCSSSFQFLFLPTSPPLPDNISPLFINTSKLLMKLYKLKGYKLQSMVHEFMIWPINSILLKTNKNTPRFPWKITILGVWMVYFLMALLWVIYQQTVSHVTPAFTLYPLMWTAIFPKSPNKDSLPMYNIPSESHWAAYLRSDNSSYEGGSHFERNYFKLWTRTYYLYLKKEIGNLWGWSIMS